MITDVKAEILRSLENASTPEKRAFDKKLIDTEKRIVGVKTAVADGIVGASLKGNYGDPEKLISLLPDDVYETVLIKCGIISGLPVGDEKRKELIDAVLPSIDNWANCDFFVARSKFMRKNHPFWFEYAKGLISSQHDFTVRFAIVSLMSYFLGDDYIDETPRRRLLRRNGSFLAFRNRSCEKLRQSRAISRNGRYKKRVRS